MIQLLRGTKQQLNIYSTIIPDGQPVFEKDTGQLKIGNGASMYSALPYVGASGGSEYPKTHVEYSEVTSMFGEPYFNGYVDFNDKLRYLFGVTSVDLSQADYFDAWELDKDENGETVSGAVPLYGVSTYSTSLSASDIPFGKGKIIGGAINALLSNVLVGAREIVNQTRDQYSTSLRMFPVGSVSSLKQNSAFPVRYDIWCLDILSTDVPYDSSNS